MRALGNRGSTQPVTRRGLLATRRRHAERPGVRAAVAGLQWALSACYVAALVYLCLLALNPALVGRAPSGLAWFGEPGSFWTVAVVLAFPAGQLLVRRLAGERPLPGPPLVALAVMAVSALALGMSSYWRCHGGQTPVFAPLAWTLGLFLSSVQNPFDPTGATACAAYPMPVALEVARLLAVATTLTTALAAALTLFRSQLDRLAIWRARSVTVVVGVDDGTVSMIRAIASRLGRGETLVALTSGTDTDAERTAHDLGAKIRAVNLDEPERISALPLWHRLDRLYLLSGDPVENLKRFNVIDAEVRRRQGERVRLPLVVRMDDPWQAEVWRRRFLAATERRWVADAVGRYEVTAAKLVRHLTTRRPGDDAEPPTTVVLCGLAPLTYALTSELAQLQRDQDLFARAHVTGPADVVIFAEAASSFVRDHEMRQGRITPDGATMPVTAHEHEPSLEAVSDYLRARDVARHAVVLADPAMESHASRLASRFPAARVYAASDTATALADFSIVGRLYSFPINMDLDPDAPQDVWERAAELIHEHYRVGADPASPAGKPWKDLDPFYQHSNRRLVLNTLWMVEAVAGHTWDSLQSEPAAPLPPGFADLPPLRQLCILGFDEDAVAEMIRIEHQDWCRYYREAGWRYAATRDDKRRRHNKLLPYEEISRRPEFLSDAQRSLASTLINLRALGYSSTAKADLPGPLPG